MNKEITITVDRNMLLQLVETAREVAEAYDSDDLKHAAWLRQCAESIEKAAQ